MLYYTPPKSSLWGHKTGRRSAASFRDGVSAFLSRAVRSYDTAECAAIVSSHLISPGDSSFPRAFLAANSSVPDGNHAMAPIVESVFERSLEWFIANQQLFSRVADSELFSLKRSYRIKAWDFDGDTDVVELDGELCEVYGSIQYLGTCLMFRTVEEYRWVSEIAKQTLGIRMNDRHIRPRKAVGPVVAKPRKRAAAQIHRPERGKLLRFPMPDAGSRDR